MAIDKAEWQYDSAQKEYCEKFGKTPDSLTEQEQDIIWEYAGNHIAFFITWLVRHDYLGEMHYEDDYLGFEPVIDKAFAKFCA